MNKNYAASGADEKVEVGTCLGQSPGHRMVSTWGQGQEGHLLQMRALSSEQNSTAGRS